MFVKSTKKITKEQYEYLQGCNVKNLYTFVENEAMESPFPPNAYGFSNPGITQKDDEYFVTWEHWDSCD